MSLSYHDKDRLPNWAFLQWDTKPYEYETTVKFAVKCLDGLVRIDVSMPEEFGQQSITRRVVLQNLIEQLTVQLATVTLEEK